MTDSHSNDQVGLLIVDYQHARVPARQSDAIINKLVNYCPAPVNPYIAENYYLFIYNDNRT